MGKIVFPSVRSEAHHYALTAARMVAAEPTMIERLRLDLRCDCSEPCGWLHTDAIRVLPAQYGAGLSVLAQTTTGVLVMADDDTGAMVEIIGTRP